MSILPSRIDPFSRLRHWIRVAIGLAIAWMAFPASAAPTFLQYDFDELDSALPSLRITASAAFSGNPLSSASTSIDVPLARFVMSQLVLLSEDRQSAEFSPSVLSLAGDPVGGSGEFDLGFSGRLPYSVSISALSIASNGVINPVQADATLRFAHLAFTTLHVQGAIEILGSIVPFDLTESLPNGFSEISGAFTPSNDPAQIAISFGVNGLRDSARIYAAPNAGFDLALDLSVGLNTLAASPTVVPEPGAALLIGGGLGLLGAGRHSRLGARDPHSGCARSRSTE
ncbi:MAG: hypothetical protein U0900_00985 [Myxococcota bacterium]